MTSVPGRLVPSRTARRAAFAVYVLLLATATHWPQLAVPMPGRPDLVVHLLAFGLWTTLAIAAELFGPGLSARNIVRTVCLAAAVACVDEATQAIPVLNRDAGFDDATANLLGVASAAAAAAVLARRWSGRAGGERARRGPSRG